MKKLYKIFIFLAVTGLSLSLVFYQVHKQGDLYVYFFDVGQGDSALIRTPTHQNILIDGGPDNTLITKLGQTLPFYDRQIDLMVLTHPHDDHLFGLVEVLKRYKVKQVLSTGVLYTTDAYLEWLKLIKEKSIPFKVALSGQEFDFAESCQNQTACTSKEVSLKVVYPFSSLANQSSDNMNQTSVVTQLQYDKIKILFTGDLEKAGESEILSHPAIDLQSQVIKIGHHGSQTSSGEEFIKAVKPQFAVISVGQNNKFGHPAKSVVDRLKSLGIKILRTDQQGDLRLESDGQNLQFD